MDRRTLLARSLGKKKVKSITNKTASSYKAPMLMSLAPYMGPWTKAQAAHLLRRTTFGPSFEMINEAESNGLALTIATLLEDNPLPTLPINFAFQNDPTTPIGDTWVGKPTDNTIPGLNTSRNVSLNGWQMGLFNEGGVSIREKLVLFWHNHFVTADINLAGYNFHYLDTIRRNALGNFRTLTEEITVSPSMLLYLNGNENTKQAPNENYSRELLELFTIGKGDAVGPGDYTNYTEDDVVALAKALTGWRSRNVDGVVDSVYVNNRHDTTDKQLSNRLNNIVITNEAENEYKTVIDIILQQTETARYLSKRLYIWLVGADIDSDIETGIIEPMAALIRDNNYEVKPAIQALLMSEHFYQESIRGCMVNHPLDFLFKLFNGLEIELPTDISIKYRIWVDIFRQARTLDMSIMEHPSVAGWKAFYQVPQYYNLWINSVSLPQRERLVAALMDGFMINQQRIQIDTLAAVSKLSNALDPNDLIADLSTVLFAFPISMNQIDFLKEILIPGLPDFEWTVEYSEYLADPNDDDKRLGVENKLKALIEAMLKMPENYLI